MELSSFKPITANGSLFITLEGIEGAGKTTQIELLQAFFEKHGYVVTRLREPGGTEFGEALRAAILTSKTAVNPLSEACLFASSRAQLLTEKILPLLEKSRQVVICDRYIDSSLAYQGVASGFGIDNILKLHTHYPLHLMPHLTFYIKISLETSLQRQEKRGQARDYFESKKISFYEKLISGYDQAAEIFPSRICVIDGEQVIENIFAQMQRHLETLLHD